VTMWYFFRYIC